MQSSTFTLPAGDGTPLFTHRWAPDGEPRAVVQVAHGLAEHSARYARLAQALTDAGYVVYAHDHRGHGRTAEPDGRSTEGLGTFGPGGFAGIVDDLVVVSTRAHEDHPGLPLFLLGHSMGSFAARAYAARYGDDLAGLLLSGTGGDPGLIGTMGRLVAAGQGRLRGEQHTSGLMDTLMFGQFNAAFRPSRTAFDWLSRDEAEVDTYVADPHCGFVSTAGLYRDMIEGVAYATAASTSALVRKSLPIYIFSGGLDPVGAKSTGPRKVADQYRECGVLDVTTRFYPEARHEILNETNRDEVTRDVIEWLDAHVPAEDPPRG